MMRTTSIVLAAMTLFAAAGAEAQQDEPSAIAARGAIFAVDPATGAVHALSAVVPANPPVYTGTLNLTVTIKLTSSLPARPVIRCGASAGLVVKISENIGGKEQIIGESSGIGSSESADAAISGDTATCQIKIPYSWTPFSPITIVGLQSPLTYTASGITASVSVTSVVLGSDQSVVRTLRSTTVSAATTAAPAQDNATTALSASAVL